MAGGAAAVAKPAALLCSLCSTRSASPSSSQTIASVSLPWRSHARPVSVRGINPIAPAPSRKPLGFGIAARSRNFNVEVIVEDGETMDSLVARFNFAVRRAGIISECRRRMFFESAQDKRKRKARRAAQRRKRRSYYERNYSKARVEVQHSDAMQAAQKEEQEDTCSEDEDNWELPEDLPY